MGFLLWRQKCHPGGVMFGKRVINALCCCANRNGSPRVVGSSVVDGEAACGARSLMAKLPCARPLKPDVDRTPSHAADRSMRRAATELCGMVYPLLSSGAAFCAMKRDVGQKPGHHDEYVAKAEITVASVNAVVKQDFMDYDFARSRTFNNYLQPAGTSCSSHLDLGRGSDQTCGTQ